MSTHIMQTTFQNTLSQLELCCPCMKIPQELLDVEKEVVGGKLVCDEELILLLY